MNDDDSKQEETERPEGADAAERLEDVVNLAGDAEDAAPVSEPATPEEKIAALEAELVAGREQLLRQLAETENVRRRAKREREETIRYGASALARDLLNVADNLQRALQSVPAEAREADETIKNLVIGVELTEKEFLSALQKQGVEKVEPLGEKFSYDRHQAMFEVPGTGKPAGTVVEVMQPGYVMHDRLLRPAMVGVAKGDPESPPDDVNHVDTTA
ncbi:MAG: nucleotide exchange factor GrpE [Alphaproteobacteria bacterium]|jgi:molecular chaperone GrpE